MNKKLYICGDSFGTSDPEYGDSWADEFTKQHTHLDVINLCVSGASNYHVHLQVKHALENKCDYLIYLATSSIRQEFVLHKDNIADQHDSLARYWNIQQPDSQKTVISTSWVRPQERVYNVDQCHHIMEFFDDYIDFVSVVEKNYIYIDYTLNLIAQSLPIDNWAWTRGGFEHQAWGTTRAWNFDRHKSRELGINLWDYYQPKIIRPYYHVTDTNVIKKVCTNLVNLLKL